MSKTFLKNSHTLTDWEGVIELILKPCKYDLKFTWLTYNNY